jgi:hypothetical protein
MTPTLHDFEIDLLAALAAERPATTTLVCVHRPTFTQQLTVLRGEFAGTASGAMVSPGGARCAIRALDLPA